MSLKMQMRLWQQRGNKENRIIQNRENAGHERTLEKWRTNTNTVNAF